MTRCVHTCVRVRCGGMGESDMCGGVECVEGWVRVEE